MKISELFRQPTRAESEQYWNAKMSAEDGSAFYAPLPDDAAEAWWQSEMKLLRMLDARAQHNAAVANLYVRAEERAKTWLACIRVACGLVALCFALFAMRYLR